MSVMSKRKPKTEPAPRPHRAGRNVNFWLPPDIGAALDAYLASAQPRTSLTAVGEMLFKEFLKAKGLWPPPEGGDSV